MTLRRTLILSVAMHVLLFGTGLAFARLAGVMLWNGPRSITVSLVTIGGSSTPAPAPAPAGRPRQARPTVQAKHEPVRPLPSTPEETAPADLPRSEAVPAASTAQAGPAGSVGSSIAGPPVDNGTTQLPGRQAGTNTGPVSSEQWAVIVSSIEKVKTYPRLARQNGIEGVVRLRFRVRPQGEVERVEIVKSSGSDLLDSASVKTVYRAGPMPYVNGWVEVPIAYVLQ